jgi:hypothetical protein
MQQQSRVVTAGRAGDTVQAGGRHQGSGAHDGCRRGVAWDSGVVYNPSPAPTPDFKGAVMFFVLMLFTAIVSIVVISQLGFWIAAKLEGSCIFWKIYNFVKRALNGR